MQVSPNTNIDDILPCICGGEFGHVADCPAQYIPTVEALITAAKIESLLKAKSKLQTRDDNFDQEMIDRLIKELEKQ